MLLSPRLRSTATALLASLTLSAASAATLGFDAPLYAQPSDSATVVGTLPAGTSIVVLVREELAAEGIAAPPPGWVAVRHSTPASGYLHNKDIGKDFAVKPDSKVLADPADDAAVIATLGPTDKVETLDPVGRFTKVAFAKPTIAFLNPVPPASRGNVSIVPDGPVPPAGASDGSAPSTVAKPTAPTADASAAPKEKAPPPAPVVVNATPRTFEGYLLRTRRFLGRGPKLDYQLVDENNTRIALLDISALLLTDPIEYFEGRKVTVYGPGLASPEITDTIIRVENLRISR